MDLYDDLEDLGPDEEDEVMQEPEESAGSLSEIASVTSLLKSEKLHELIEAVGTLGLTPRTASKSSGPVEEDPEYKILVNATNMSAEIDSEILVVHRFIKERYGIRFPELETLIPSAIDYVRTVKAIGNETDLMNIDLRSILPSATVMIVTVTATTTNGRQLTPDELTETLAACDAALTLDSMKRKILEYIESRMTFIAPNLSSILGSSTAAKLMSVAGGLTNLSKIPACNLQVLGKVGKSAGILAKGQEKHAGYIFYSDFVQGFPKDIRVKASARIDKEREVPDGSVGREMKEEVEKKLEKLQEPPPSKKPGLAFHLVLFDN
ncbi:U4/U6 small nuclear ribonucleoprotein Prp31 [Phlyctochytrium bullatum]|nr:U4/U6 small nuclear ribonucleoprotein Prp31 [Phlyctochytrium bullatum]